MNTYDYLIKAWRGDPLRAAARNALVWPVTSVHGPGAGRARWDR
jgi:hypothetical protein